MFLGPVEACWTAGYGITEDAVLPDSLKSVGIHILKKDKCVELMDEIGNTYQRSLCDRPDIFIANKLTENGDGVVTTESSCAGDSGGPVICSRDGKAHLVGVFSFITKHCGTTDGLFFTGYSKVDADWIRETIRGN